MKYVLSCLLAVTAVVSTPAVLHAQELREWDFRVSLDGKEVGSQRFSVLEQDGVTRLETEANLAVKMLFVTVYRYLHRNVETWDGECLAEIETSTKVNGKKLAVKGSRGDGYFEVSGTGDTARLPECVMSFAYWNPQFLNQKKLLNSQDGRYIDVDVSGPVDDQLTVRGETQPAQRYRLVADKIDMQLWYSLDNVWLALESKTGGGRTLQYELL